MPPWSRVELLIRSARGNWTLNDFFLNVCRWLYFWKVEGWIIYQCLSCVLIHMQARIKEWLKMREGFFFFNNPYNYLKLHRLFHHSFVSCLNSSLLNIDFNSLPLMLCVCVCVFRCVGVCTLFLMSCEVQMSHC